MTTVPEPEQQPVPRATAPVLIASLLLAIVALVLLAWLSDEVLEGQTRHFDLYVRLWVHRYATHNLTVVMAALSQLGSALFLTIATALLIVRFLLVRWKRAAAWLAITMAGALVLDTTLKFAFHRTRPLAFFGPEPHSYSFPSGHALASFCFYGVLAALLAARVHQPVIRVAAWIMAALLVAGIGFSRVYLGVHYPTDVIAGYMAAAVWVGALVAADRMRTRQKA